MNRREKWAKDLRKRKHRVRRAKEQRRQLQLEEMRELRARMRLGQLSRALAAQRGVPAPDLSRLQVYRTGDR